MTTIAEIFPAPWVEIIGWTILHSLWQSFFVFVVVLGAMRCIPSRLSDTRYLVATVGLVLISFLSIATLVQLSSTTAIPSSASLSLHESSTVTEARVFQKSLLGPIDELLALVERNLGLVVSIWFIGATLFSFRLVGGWWYVQRIRSDATFLGNDWSRRVQTLASSLNIRQFIPLAESSLIQAPVIIGILKPMILFPVGMCAGISVEQLESIILHELIHIKRKDYLVNIVQSFLESIYFFNPFVWMISSIIKCEREHCCDDAVVSVNGNPLAYVRALAMLEEARLSRPGFAISFADDKNQLLTRIKRLMEKSVRNYSGRERIIPVALLIIGLVCASWLTINSREHAKAEVNTPKISAAASDTTGNGNIFRQELIMAPPVDVVSPVIEIFPIAPLDITLPLLADPADVDIDIVVPPLEVTPVMELFLSPQFRMDTIPLLKSSGSDWDAFSKEFQEKFASRFGDFYKDHQKEFEGMMKEMERKFDHDMDDVWVNRMEAMARDQERMAHLHVDRVELDRNQLERHRELAKQMERDAKRMEEESHIHMRELERTMKDMEANLKRFQEELRSELIKDGYLKKDEKVNHMEITDETIKINGTLIKPADEKKYKTLIDKFSAERLDRSRSRTVPGRME